jgi:hypothetical protein
LEITSVIQFYRLNPNKAITLSDGREQPIQAENTNAPENQPTIGLYFYNAGGALAAEYST